MSQESNDISRSGRFILHFQIQSLLESLTNVSASNSEITSVTREVVRKVRNDMLKITSGTSIESIPEINDDVTSADLLIIVALLNGTSKSFLSEEELATLASRTKAFIGGVAKAKETFGI